MAYAISNNTPGPGYVQWVDVHIQYKGISYDITNGYTNYRYIYWLAATPTTLVVSDTFPVLGNDDLLVFLNKDGIAMVVPTATVLDGGLIVPGSIYASAIAANTITGAQIAAGTITAGNIAAGTITSDKIAANTIGAGNIAANAVISDKIVSGAVTADKLAANSVTATKILANSIQTAHISAAGISADVLTAGKVESSDGKVYFNLDTAEIREAGIAQVVETIERYTTDYGSLNLTTGAQETSSYYKRTPYFRIMPGTSVATSGTLYTQVKFFYTAAKAFISYSTSASIVAPANAAYVRVRLYNAGIYATTWEPNVKGTLSITAPVSILINPSVGFEMYVGDQKRFGVSAKGRIFADSITNLDNTDYFAAYGVGGAGGQIGFTAYEPNGAGGVRMSGKLLLFGELGSFAITDQHANASFAFEKSGAAGTYVEDFVLQSIPPVNRGTLIKAHTEVASANNYTELDVGGVANYAVGVDSAGAYVKHGETTKRRVKHQRNICSGQCTLNSDQVISVSFGRTLTGTPRVVITPNTAVTGVIAPKVRSVSTTGFTATIGGTGIGNTLCDYIAVVD